MGSTTIINIYKFSYTTELLQFYKYYSWQMYTSESVFKMFFGENQSYSSKY